MECVVNGLEMWMGGWQKGECRPLHYREALSSQGIWGTRIPVSSDGRQKGRQMNLHLSCHFWDSCVRKDHCKPTNAMETLINTRAGAPV